MVNVTSDTISWLTKGTPGYNLFADPPKQPPVPKYILSATQSEETTPQRRIASRGTEVFVAVGCEIRCVDLRFLKAQYEEVLEGAGKATQSSTKPERGYQVLGIPELDFTIHQLDISPDGQYLAIVGERRVAVCLLPSPGFVRSSDEKLRAVCRQIGKFYHNDSSEKTVRAVWHPFGFQGSSLVILTSDAFVRVYDITMDQETTCEVPDQVFDLNSLAGRERQRTSFIPDPESFEPASCCFASGDLCWRPFSLYILMRGGDIYSLCPIVPSRWVPSENYLPKLQRELSTQLEALEDSTDVTRSSRLGLRQQAKWLEEVLNQETARRSSSINRRDQEFYFTRPESISLTPTLQGPFLLQPAPVDTSAEEVYACDIIHTTSDPVATISVVWSNANIDVFLEFEPIQARWVGKKLRHKQPDEDKNPPIIATFETIKLNIPLPEDHARKHWPVFVENPLIGEVLFVAHYAGVEAVDMSEWLKGLKLVADPEEGEDFIAKQLQRTQGSIVKKVVDSGKTLPNLPHSILGCLVLQDSYVGYILIASSKTLVYTADFDIPFEFRNVVDLEDASILAKPPKPTPVTYIPSISMPLLEPPAILREPSGLYHFMLANMHRNPQLMKGPLHYNAESLEILRQAREQVKREYEKLTSVAEIMYARAKQQKAEYERQLLKVHELITRQEGIVARNVKSRVQILERNQQELKIKFDAAFRGFIKSGHGGSGEVSVVKTEREREWEAELQKIIEKTGFMEKKGKENNEDVKKGLEKRAEQVRGIWEDMKPIVEKNDGENGTASGSADRGDGVPEELRKKKVTELKEMLRKEQFLIDNTKQKLEKLEASCEAMGL
ncbi:hypothetical protein EV426DRAFT_602039 [Tirmania nivea]|nr:hypothetical protein EV426DRAFT_602039 [Tirmania nivea]